MEREKRAKNNIVCLCPTKPKPEQEAAAMFVFLCLNCPVELRIKMGKMHLLEFFTRLISLSHADVLVTERKMNCTVFYDFIIQ